MGIFNRSSFMDIIRYDEQSYLIWKWHPTGTTPLQNKRENAIRWGTSLRVREGSVAVFVYSQPNGVIHDFIMGPCDCRLDTRNLPVLAEIQGLLYGGDTPFQAEVNIKKMQDTQRIETEHMEGILKAQREETQYAQRIQTQTEHMAAHQLDQQTAVGIAAAEALEQMGTGGAMEISGGGINLAVYDDQYDDGWSYWSKYGRDDKWHDKRCEPAYRGCNTAASSSSNISCSS